MSLVCHHCISMFTSAAPARQAIAMPSADISRVPVDRSRLNHEIFPRQEVEAERAGNRFVSVAQQSSRDGLFKPWNARSNDLLTPQIHERDAGIALHICGDTTDFARTGDHVSRIVTSKIQSRFLELRVIDVLNPFAASSRPALIDKKLIVVLDQEFGSVSRMLICITEQLAGNDEVSGE